MRASLLLCMFLFTTAQEGDAQGQVTLLADLNPGPEGSDPGHATSFDGRTFFFADDGVHGYELWATDGTAVERISDLPGTDYISGHYFLGREAGLLYFVARVPHGNEWRHELWATDGTTAWPVTDLDPSPPYGPPYGTANFAGRIFFGYPTDLTGELYTIADGQVELFAEIRPGPEGSNPRRFTVVGDRLFFAADDGVHGEELWMTDGETVTLVADIQPGPESSAIYGPVAYDGELIFSADDGVYGRELWRSDGVTTSRITDLTPGPEGAYWDPQGLVGGRLLLSRWSDNAGWFWVFDGQAVTPASTPLIPFYNYYDAVVFDEGVYFIGDDGVHGREVWAWEGDDLRLVADIFSGGGDYEPCCLTPFEGRLYFSGAEVYPNYELWATDGHTAHQVVDLRPGTDPSYAYPYGELNGTLLFSADDGVHGRELWLLQPEPTAGDLPAPTSEAPVITVYPNPTRSTTNVQIILSEPSALVLDVFDALGRRIRRTDLGVRPAGPSPFALDADGLAPGLYLLRLTGPDGPVASSPLTVRP